MLIEFTVENFQSIKDEYTFSMEATKFKSDHIYNTFSTGTTTLLSSSVIFGPNGSGKSTLIYAMKLMRDLIESGSNSKGYLRRFIPFSFNKQSKDKPIKLEVKFLQDNIFYRYGFKISNSIVIEEWLYSKNNKAYAKETPLFKRNGQTFENFAIFKKEADLIKKEKKTREDRLYLEIVAEFNGTISRQVLDWFSTFNCFSSIHTSLEDYTLEKLKDPDTKSRIINFMNSADFGIIDMEEKELNIDEISNKDEIPDDILKKLEKEGISSVMSYHNLYDGDKYIGKEHIGLHSESDGTRKLFNLAGAIFEILDNGETLVIDELDNSFHTKMLEEIIKLFNSEKNKNNAQLIFACHDTNILTQKLFRRDQIWFTDKNIYGETELYSLIDFGTRKDTQLEKNYLAGKYGSIPAIHNLEY